MNSDAAAGAAASAASAAASVSITAFAVVASEAAAEAAEAAAPAAASEFKAYLMNCKSKNLSNELQIAIHLIGNSYYKI